MPRHTYARVRAAAWRSAWRRSETSVGWDARPAVMTTHRHHAHRHAAAMIAQTDLCAISLRPRARAPCSAVRSRAWRLRLALREGERRRRRRWAERARCERARPRHAAGLCGTARTAADPAGPARWRAMQPVTRPQACCKLARARGPAAFARPDRARRIGTPDSNKSRKLITAFGQPVRDRAGAGTFDIWRFRVGPAARRRFSRGRAPARSLSTVESA